MGQEYFFCAILFATALISLLIAHWGYINCWSFIWERQQGKGFFQFFSPVFLLFISILFINLQIKFPEFLKEYSEITSFIIGLAIVENLGQLLPILLKNAVKHLQTNRPESMPKETWDELQRPLEGGGKYIGFLERTLFFIILWSGNPLYIGALLTFKVAAKWEAWKNIVQVPSTKLEEFPKDTEYFIFRRKWGSMLLTRFVVGTFSNILFAVIGYGFYYWSMKILYPCL